MSELTKKELSPIKIFVLNYVRGKMIEGEGAIQQHHQPQLLHHQQHRQQNIHAYRLNIIILIYIHKTLCILITIQRSCFLEH